MKIAKTFIIAALVLLISCKDENSDQKTSNIAEFTLNTADYTILKYNSKNNWIYRNAKPTDLNSAELIEIESILNQAISDNNKVQTENLRKGNKTNPENKRTQTGFELSLDNYQRQYVPYINSSGEKEIWINFRCGKHKTDKWKTELLPPVTDGGNCNYQIKINLSKKSHSDLHINGYA
jgi:hypothetical protein